MMDCADLEEFNKYLEELDTARPNINDVLRGRTSEASGTPQGVKDLEDNVKFMLDEYRKKLFFEETEDNKEILRVEELVKSNDLEENKLLPYLKEQTSLLSDYNLSDPYLPLEDSVGTSTSATGLQLLESALKKCNFHPPSKGINNEEPSSIKANEIKRAPLSVGDFANILATAGAELGLQKKTQLETGSVKEPCPPLGHTDQDPKSSKKSQNNVKKKKNLKNGYEPKIVSISWSDPRTDLDFEKELETLLCCDAFELAPMTSDLPKELDEIVEEFAPPLLPRDIVSMLAPTSEKDFADWEHSIKLEKEEYTDSEESEVEDFKTELDEIKTVLKNDEELKKKASLPCEVKGQLDVSEFMKIMIPPVVEDIIAVRDDIGNILTYESVKRGNEHLSKEYERVYLGAESDSEEEEVDDIENADISWEKDKVRGSEITESDSKDVSEKNLCEDLEKIKLFVETNVSELLENKIDPALERQVEVTEELLDRLSVPKVGEIKLGKPQDLMKEEFLEVEHIFKAHQGKICPPGLLEVEISSDDEDLTYYRNLCSFKKQGDGNEPIMRPPPLPLKFQATGEFEEDITKSDEESKPKINKSTLLPQCQEALSEIHSSEDPVHMVHLFDADYDNSMLNGFKDKEKNIPDLFAESDSSDEEFIPELTEAQEMKLDDIFKKEHVDHLGTVEELGNNHNDEEETLELQSLASFSESFLTYPFISKKAEKFDLVRARRIIAQNFPELRDVASVDHSASPLVLDSSDESSSSSDYEEPQINFKHDPFELEEILKKEPSKCPSCSESEAWLTGDENTEPDYEPLSPPCSNHAEFLQLEQKKGRKKKKSKKRPKGEENDTSKKSKSHTSPTVASWLPIGKFDKPSYEGAIHTIEQLSTAFKAPHSPIRFKTPVNLKAWLKNEYYPSREEINEWKRIYNEHFGDVSILNKVINSEKQQVYDNVILKVEDIPHFSDTDDCNQILIFKRILEKIRRDKERKEKAEEIISNYEFYSTEVTPNKSSEQDAPDPKNSNEISQSNNTQVNFTDTKIVNVTPSENYISEPSLKSNQIEEENVKPPSTPVIKLRDVLPRPKKEEWAEEVNCNVKRELSVTPAMSFSFELDGFQREAVQALENGFNVFVSAHTSAGKTVVAEYAIAMSKRNRSKAVYTSPVKALSNQKYADFKRIFGSVGLITGDTQLNENAECLIMTTEILRSMLYNSSEKIRDLEFVVFDEVHYINDPERGHVWEEVLILLPSQVQIVMLSATVPNTMEFANWVGRTKQRKVMVCMTHHRPVPLNHYIYTGTGGPSPGNTYLLKSGDGTFNLHEYIKSQEVMKKLQETERENRIKQQMKRSAEEKEWKKKGNPGKPPVPPGEDLPSKLYKKDQTMWIALISFLSKKDWLPAVCFVFSRKKCDSFADMLQTVDLTTKSEKSFIHKFIKSQVEKLDVVDQDLPQINIMKRQLDRGIGVHHSGILPVMKEIVEVLFQEGKVKLLFATETFAMGVNMPARTVVFHAVKKFDGNETRLLQPAEYVQMAGRAGRRGKDSAGNVIILTRPNDIIARHDLETLLYGNPCRLISKFRLSYRMILNTLTVSGMLTVQNMMERSFCENKGQMKRKFLEKDLIEAEKIEKTLKKSMNQAVDDIVADLLVKFYDRAINFIEMWFNLRVAMIMQSQLYKELRPGKLIRVCIGSLIQRTALILESEHFQEDPYKNSYKVLIMNHTNEFERTIAPDGHNMSEEELEIWYKMVALFDDFPNEMEILSGPNEYSVIVVKGHHITGIFKENLKVQKNTFEEFLSFTKKKNQNFGKKRACDAGDSIAMLLFGATGKYKIIEETQTSYENFDLACQAISMWSILEDIKKSPISMRSPLILKSFRKVFLWKQALQKVNKLRNDLSAENMTLYPDFKSKMELLKERGYISLEEQVQMKGFMAARIGKYELIVCELLVENVLLDLSPEETAALLSFLVYQSSTEDSPIEQTLPQGLQAAIVKCKKIMAEVTTLERKYDIRDFEGSEISKLKFGLVPVMYAWAKQEPLKNIMDMATGFEFQEGLLVRWIQQLLETLKEVEAAARLMGDPGVPARLQAAGQCIKRGIVFAPSLYTTMI